MPTATDKMGAPEQLAENVWVPDKEAGFLPARVVKEEGDVYVCSLADGNLRNVPSYDVQKANPARFDKAEDIANLTYLNEASVVHNLRERYFSGLIYTYSGPFCIALNPYRHLPIYTDSVVASYKGKRREEQAPHVFAVADEAMRNMLEARENQSLLITGESGAGKTENTKKVIQYLAAISADPTAPGGTAAGATESSSAQGLSRSGTLPRNSSSRHVLDQLRGLEGVAAKRLGLLERQILQANPILEAFGNAQTIRNNNSSRFGKFVRIEFTSLGAIAGANVDWYLLEKSRVVTRSEKERSFHIFYQLLRGASAEVKAKLLLSSSPGDYGYLKSTRRDVEGIDDASEWAGLVEALNIVGFSPEEQHNLFKVIAAILHIGNIELADDRSEQARITNSPVVEKVCHILGLPEQELTTALLRPKVKAGREWVTQARTKRQVTDEMASLCKTLYEKTFSTIVDRINVALDRPTSKSSFIGVLDIAGFEIFEANSFEQLCINYTNEKLQQFFNHHMFVLEQEEYAREEIEWDFVNFGLDLQPTIDLIESTTPIGILSCLDEECIMPKASDATFTEKLNRIWSTNKDGTAKDAVGFSLAAERGVAHGSTKYKPARFAQGFTIKHYAGDVEYRTDGWLDKNKDPLNDNLTRVLSEAADRFVAGLFAEYAADDELATAAGAGAGGPVTPAKRRIKRGAFRTVGQRHKEQLNSLMSQLGATQPHFVRCIVPNPEKRAGKINVPLVLEQLRCNGVLEGIRIARLGYPNRLLFSEFRSRYEVLTPDIIPKGYMDGRKACQRMVEALDLDRSLFKVGLTKIFFKAGVLADMEERRDALLHDIFSRFQAACRMYTARRQMKKILNRAAAVRTIQRNARVYVELREWPWWQLYTKVRPLLTATRHDEELKRKQLELAMIKERAERDQREREALEALKFGLEAEKKRVEDQLEAERALLLDKDQLLARSKERESALEDDLAAMQADVDQLDNQLERALAAQKASEQGRNELKAAFDAAAEHLIRLEAEQKAWSEREALLTQDVGKHTETLDRLQAEKAALSSERAELGRKLADKEQDLERIQKRMAAAIADVEAKLAQEQQAREAEKSRAAKLEDQSRQSTNRLAELARASTDFEAALQTKDVELKEAKAQAQRIASERDAATKQHAALEAKLATTAADFAAARAEGSRAAEARAALQKELDETRRLMDAKTSEDTKQRELQRLKEQELQTLRADMAAIQKELATVQHSSSEQAAKLRAEADSAKKQHADLERTHRDLSARAQTHESRVLELTAAIAVAQKDKGSAESQLQALRERVESAENHIAELQGAKAELEKRLSQSTAKQQDLEDALLHLERDQASWKVKADQLSVELSAESKRRELIESTARGHERSVNLLNQQHAVKDKELARLKDELAATLAELKRTQSMTNKTIVEHVHVLEEAKKYTDRQLADAQSKLQELAHYTKTLEKSKSRLTSENEDLSRMVSSLQQENRSHASVKPAAAAASSNGDARAIRSLEQKVGELNSALLTAKRERDEAQSAKRRQALETDEIMSRSRQQYESRIRELERELQGSQNARSTTFQNLQALVEQSAASSPKGGSDDLRRHLLEELRSGHDELERDVAAKADLLRSHGATNGKAEKPLYTYGNIAPPAGAKTNGNGPSIFARSANFNKRASIDLAGASNEASRHAALEMQRAEDRSRKLQGQLDALEKQLASSARVRNHLEESLKGLNAEMSAARDANHSLESAKRKLASDNQRLASLLRDEEEARRQAETALMNGAAAADVRDRERSSSHLSSAARDEEMRQALLAQQREANAQLQAAHEAASNMRRAQLAMEAELSDSRRKLQELDISRASDSQAAAEAREAAHRYKRRLDEVQEDLAAAEERANQLQHAYDEIVQEGGVDEVIEKLQAAVERYKAQAEGHMKQLEALPSSLRSQASMRRPSSIPPLSPTRSPRRAM